MKKQMHPNEISGIPWKQPLNEFNKQMPGHAAEFSLRHKQARLCTECNQIKPWTEYTVNSFECKQCRPGVRNRAGSLAELENEG